MATGPAHPASAAPSAAVVSTGLNTPRPLWPRLKAAGLSFIFFVVPLINGLPVVWRWVLWFGCWIVAVLWVFPEWFTNLEALSTKKRAAASLFLILIFPVVWSWLARSQWKKEQAGYIEGKIESIDKAPAAPTPAIKIGFHDEWPTKVEAMDSQTPEMKFLHQAGFSIDVKDGRLRVSTGVKDRRGDVVAVVAQNYWTVIPLRYLDKNYNRDTFEVMDSSFHPLLQVRVLADVVRVQGEWFDEYGQGLELVQDADGAHIIHWKDSTEERALEKPIYPIFKYPSNRYWAQFFSLGK